jgi:hypothetical protein
VTKKRFRRVGAIEVGSAGSVAEYGCEFVEGRLSAIAEEVQRAQDEIGRLRDACEEMQRQRDEAQAHVANLKELLASRRYPTETFCPSCRVRAMAEANKEPAY